MYYYKTTDEQGKIIQLESRNAPIKALPPSMTEVSQSDYNGLREEFIAINLANSEENIGYEPNLREELAEVKEQLSATQEALDVMLLGGIE